MTGEGGAGRSRYGVSPAVALRGLGVGSVLLGTAVVGGVLLSALGVTGTAGWLVTVPLALLALIGLVFMVVGLWRLTGRGPRLEMDDAGFVNATGPGAGVRRAAWKDVRTVRADGPVVVVELAGGRQSIIRTGSLAVPPKHLAAELRQRLNRGHGYRPLT
ncbi:MAG TPA: hypothetical protein VK894_02240 [Jiangellales bacterium]|nr:hypothetical protein [Jiangellales bacterium]